MRFASDTPPVGQNATCGIGAPMALSAAAPPEGSAGKNLSTSRPRSRSRMASVAVAAPGSIGSPASSAASRSRSVAPGETPKVAPASIAARTSCGVSSVPAPTRPPGTRAISRIASSAAGVRSVTSRARSPPATRASAKGRACVASSTTSTGMTGARAQTSRAARLESWGVMRPVLPCGWREPSGGGRPGSRAALTGAAPRPAQASPPSASAKGPSAAGRGIGAMATASTPLMSSSGTVSKGRSSSLEVRWMGPAPPRTSQGNPSSQRSKSGSSAEESRRRSSPRNGL